MPDRKKIYQLNAAGHAHARAEYERLTGKRCFSTEEIAARAENSLARNGNDFSCAYFEISGAFTKSRQPELISFDTADFDSILAAMR